MAMRPDQIIISQMELSTCIGATEEERREPQRMLVSLVLEPKSGFANVNDNLDLTADYAAAAQEVRQLAATGKRALVETLAEDIAGFLLRRFPLAAAEVELRKFILPETEYVGVRIRREQ